jgi:uncharacterized protein YodC (DUF2158 family)
MTESPLVEGDLVLLKALRNAPPMSVQSISADGKTATCMWFDSDGSLHEKTFLVRTLEKYEPDSGVSGA